MPLDPSIISSYNPTSGIDVNALMTQRMQGMANINAMERQRQADALALEDRAAAQQKEQAAALVTTLAPAYATAFKGKGTKEAIMAGYNILPPDVQATVKPQIDSLMSMPSDDLRLAALESSLAGSDLGRTLLDRIPTEIQRINADIQQGQLTLAQQKFAAEQAAGPEASYTHVKGPDGKVYLMNTKTGEMKMPTVGDGTDINAGTALPEGMDAKTKTKFDQAYPKAASSLRTAVTGMDNTLVALEKLINDPGLKEISGTVGAYTPNISADAKRAQALFDQIKAGAGLAALTELRQASPTGGALGNVSNQEGATLRDSRGAFLQTQEYDDLRNALIDYYNVLEGSKANVIGAFNDTYSYRGENAAESILQSAQEQAEKISGQTKARFSTPKSNLPSGVTVKRND
jgi:hypothetical protein